MKNNKQSKISLNDKSGGRIHAFDGLRFIAISLVVASHSGFLAQGGLGNDIFFAISGFFAVSPFRKNSEAQYLSGKGIISYYVGRVFRIFPVFWCYLLFAALLFPGRFFVFNDMTSYSSFFQNMFFLKSQGHLWFLQQEIVFYIIVPVILILLAIVKKANLRMKKTDTVSELLCVLIMMMGTILAIKYFPNIPFRLSGNGGEVVFRLGSFMLGMTTAYVYRLYVAAQQNWEKCHGYKILSDIVIISFIVFCIVSSEQILSLYDAKYEGFFIGWAKPTLCSMLACIVLFFIATGENCFANKFLGNQLFAYLGEISYEIYLFHWVFIFSLKNAEPISSFILIYFVTICVAGVINLYVGKPAIKLSKRIIEKI